VIKQAMIPEPQEKGPTLVTLSTGSGTKTQRRFISHLNFGKSSPAKQKVN
jgi:hypothetical protein